MIRTIQQAEDWCNRQLKECGSSGSNYYQSLVEVRDIIVQFKNNNALMEEILSQIKGEECCSECKFYHIRAGDDFETPSHYCELRPTVYQNEVGHCNQFLYDVIERNKAKQALDALNDM